MNINNISSLSNDYNSNAVQEAAGISMLKKSISNAENNVMQLLDSIKVPDVGNNIDITV